MITRYPDRGNLREKEFLLLIAQGCTPWWRGCYRGGSSRQLATRHPLSRSREHWRAALFPLYGPRSQLGEQCHPQWVGLPTLISMVKITSHRHAVRLIFQVTPEANNWDLIFTTTNPEAMDAIREHLKGVTKFSPSCFNLITCSPPHVTW